MSNQSVILGEWAMRRGDRLPLLALAIEDDRGNPADLTDGTAYFVLHHEENLGVITPPPDHLDGSYTGAGSLVLPAFIYDPPNGIVIYDWPQAETVNLTVGVLNLSVVVTWPDGASLTAPSVREARLLVRPSALHPLG